MSVTPRLHHSTTVDHSDAASMRGRVVDFRHTTGVLADLRRTGYDTFEITLVLGGGDDSERRVFSGVRAGESLHLHA
ncbi:hypothetical protein [Dietzia sp. ANT_WB102]|uniref:hypothetical protein n=1 Tax=Dietzia sp. ANT_WB102 TaxID=2597345 RepID=UPI0011EEC512|nr:hypothetical protein [Dietzia sp. ANT_WB102]KAA0919612.1 hypothetical protein FQ137_10450 [Dietzia sp. ANT_WB102]